MNAGITMTITLRDGTVNVTNGMTLDAFQELGNWLAAYPANPINIIFSQGTRRIAADDVVSVELRAELQR